MTRRVVLGRQADGSYGLRVSLPNVDAYTGDSSDAAKFSFDSRWSDIAKIHQIGIGTVTVQILPNGNVNPISTSIPFPDLGYLPFCELRYYDGLIRDDYVSTSRSGVSGQITTNAVINVVPRAGQETTTLLYVIYRIPIPTQ